jgi:exopolysaccharide production protein ExoQ
MTAKERVHLGFVALAFLGTQSALGGAVTAILLVAVIGALLLSKIAPFMGRMRYFWPLLAYPLLQVLSTVWSLNQPVTIRYSVQLLATGAFGAYCGFFLTERKSLWAIFTSSALAVIISIASRHKGESAEGDVLVGIAGSKDAMSFLAQLAAQSAMGIAMLPRLNFKWRVLAGLIFLPAAYVSLSVHAATGVITLILGAIIFAGLLVLALTPFMFRIITVVCLLLLGVMAVIFHHELADLASDFMFRVLHKDATLTGRTVLWRFAEGFISQRPVLGRGYKEIWLGTSVDTEGLLRWAGLTDGRGFFFHETYLDAGVDSGLIGVAVLITTFVAILAGIVWKFVAQPSVERAFFLTMFLLLMVRSFGETLMQPFSPYCAIVFATGVYAFQGGRRKQSDAGIRIKPGRFRRANTRQWAPIVPAPQGGSDGLPHPGVDSIA